MYGVGEDDADCGGDDGIEQDCQNKRIRLHFALSPRPMYHATHSDDKMNYY